VGGREDGGGWGEGGEGGRAGGWERDSTSTQPPSADYVIEAGTLLPNAQRQANSKTPSLIRPPTAAS
jgi:hypothetical protein